MDEKEQLAIKIDKLAAFLNKGTREPMHWIQYDLLQLQLLTMQQYFRILSMRTTSFESAEK